ncbi:MAG: hypothetical protein JO062_14175 [Bryobacterales bacterium]|nr:hypothetical protein [Bryobacterales bacterium]
MATLSQSTPQGCSGQEGSGAARGNRTAHWVVSLKSVQRHPQSSIFGDQGTDALHAGSIPCSHGIEIHLEVVTWLNNLHFQIMRMWA